MATLFDLHNAVAAVCPIIGVEGNITDRTTWKIDFDPSATPAQQAAGQQVLATFDPTEVFTVTMIQGKLALVNAGLYTQVKAAVAADPTTEVWWDHSEIMERNNPILLAMATKLNLTSSQIDALFKSASTL